MSRTVRERDISSKSKRERLPPRGKPYWRSIDEGLHLGYRRGHAAGKWVLRRYLGKEKYVVETIGLADDNQQPDGQHVLSFNQAQARIRELARQYRAIKKDDAGLTVAGAVQTYLSTPRGRDQHLRLKRHVLAAEIASRPLGALTEEALAVWRNGLPTTLKASTRKRITTDLRAALNVTAKSCRKNLPPDFPAIVQQGLSIKEPTVAVTREPQILTDADIRRVIEAAWKIDAQGGWGGDLGRLVLVLAATGARFSQVIRMNVADVQDNRLMIPVSNKGRGTKAATRIAVRVGDDVIAALRPVTAGRKGHETLLLRPHWAASRSRAPVGRSAWNWSTEITPLWTKIRELSELDPSITSYSLRHSSIVRGLRAGLPVRLVAALHDTGTVMIERNYSVHIVDALDELAARAIVPLTTSPISQIKNVG